MSHHCSGNRGWFAGEDLGVHPASRREAAAGVHKDLKRVRLLIDGKEVSVGDEQRNTNGEKKGEEKGKGKEAGDGRKVDRRKYDGGWASIRREPEGEGSKKENVRKEGSHKRSRSHGDLHHNRHRQPSGLQKDKDKDKNENENRDNSFRDLTTESTKPRRAKSHRHHHQHHKSRNSDGKENNNPLSDPPSHPLISGANPPCTDSSSPPASPVCLFPLHALLSRITTSSRLSATSKHTLLTNLHSALVVLNSHIAANVAVSCREQARAAAIQELSVNIYNPVIGEKVSLEKIKANGALSGYLADSASASSSVYGGDDWGNEYSKHPGEGEAESDPVDEILDMYYGGFGDPSDHVSCPEKAAIPSLEVDIPPMIDWGNLYPPNPNHYAPVAPLRTNKEKRRDPAQFTDQKPHGMESH